MAGGAEGEVGEDAEGRPAGGTSESLDALVYPDAELHCQTHKVSQVAMYQQQVKRGRDWGMLRCRVCAPCGLQSVVCGVVVSVQQHIGTCCKGNWKAC